MDGNFAKENPELVIIGGDNKPILNPGEPRVKQFIVDTIEEIITNMTSMPSILTITFIHIQV